MRLSVKPLLRSLAAAATLLAAVPAVQSQDMQGTELARRALHVCASCHGEGGISKNPTFPHLAGQPAQYTVQQLRDFRAQQRSEGDQRAYMWGVSALLDDETIKSLAEYYAQQKPPAGRVVGAAPGTLARGKKIFEVGYPDKGVRACADCHGHKAEGAAGFPRLAGQHAAYLERQLQVFGGRLRPHGALMQAEVANLTKADKRAVALYLQSL